MNECLALKLFFKMNIKLIIKEICDFYLRGCANKSKSDKAAGGLGRGRSASCGNVNTPPLHGGVGGAAIGPGGDGGIEAGGIDLIDVGKIRDSLGVVDGNVDVDYQLVFFHGDAVATEVEVIVQDRLTVAEHELQVEPQVLVVMDHLARAGEERTLRRRGHVGVDEAESMHTGGDIPHPVGPSVLRLPVVECL